ncbi:LysR family transcriptional regulator [Christensenellaceae bacterium OttesenSCG-928-K19]|nr:LysR family transcriptional regulator [Christensenellaceae bacterium OttesenSCG-928-K19]
MTGEMRYDLRLTLYGDKKFFGPGVADLLKLADEKGSLHMAAQQMHMAYSKAWRIVKEAEDALGFSLLHMQTGGKNGGGASLTAEGREFLMRFTAMNDALQEHARTLFEEYFSREKTSL